MQTPRRSSLWGAIVIILILTTTCMFFHTQNEYKKLKNYNEVLCATVNKQSNIISDLESENNVLKNHISQLETDNIKFKQEQN